MYRDEVGAVDHVSSDTSLVASCQCSDCMPHVFSN